MTTKKMIFVAMYATESGDRGVVGYFTSGPTDQHMTAYFKKLMPDEFIEEEGKEKRLVRWEVRGLKETRLPTPIPVVESI